MTGSLSRDVNLNKDAFDANITKLREVCSLGSEVARLMNLRSQLASTGSLDRALTKMLKPALGLPGAKSLPGFFCCRFGSACIHMQQQLMAFYATASEDAAA